MTRLCTSCKSDDCCVVETRLAVFHPFKGPVVRRRRRCRACAACWWTIEIPEDLALELADEKPEAVGTVVQQTFRTNERDIEEGEA